VIVDGRITDKCCLFRYDSFWLYKHHVILVFSLNDSQHVTNADYSLETIQSTITSTDITGIDQEERQSTDNFAFQHGLTKAWPAIEGNSGFRGGWVLFANCSTIASCQLQRSVIEQDGKLIRKLQSIITY